MGYEFHGLEQRQTEWVRWREGEVEVLLLRRLSCDEMVRREVRPGQNEAMMREEGECR